MRCAAVGSSKKVVWVKTNNQEVFTTALECGISDTIYIDDDNAETWQHLGRINVIKAQPDNTLTDTTTGTTVGCIQRLANAADLIVAQEIATTTTSGIVVIDAADWQIIPAENLVAVFQSIPGTQLLCVARSVVDSAIPMLEALEIGADGVVLETADPQEVRLLAAYFAQRNSESQEILTYDVATVSVVKAVASGDRACVDLASVMVPGEGMLVGSFARGMFLVHSECEESGYINSRPFRVNAGPVHAYVQVPGGLTRYLSELRSGDEVEIVDSEGRRRSALVGRVKIEKRPLVLVDAVTQNGIPYSILLQNAETVKLVGPNGRNTNTNNSSSTSDGDGRKNWRAISVSELKQGDELYVCVQGGARHTGVSIEESITER